MTLIAFVGSVFSPTYFRARAREAAPPQAERFCALNLVLYRDGRRHWALTEHPRDRVQREADVLALGGSTLAWEDDALVARVDERSAGLGLPLRGTIRLRPRGRWTSPLALDPAGRHHWWAVAPLAAIEVEMERPGLRFSGSGYHDTNFGAEPLEHGFHRWSWSRAELRRGTAVLYDAQPRDGAPSEHGLLFRPDGEVLPLAAPARHALARTGWGLPRATRSDDGPSPVLRRTLEDTPFYSRSLVETTLDGQRVAAMHESLCLDRFARPWVQRLLPFRIRRGWRA
ncbi:MAG: carotenoid 1,2-hydratase [Myxococcales bacterium]|nr:carotenoid 1,2-hydratase [Myxococcales bacterium]